MAARQTRPVPGLLAAEHVTLGTVRLKGRRLTQGGHVVFITADQRLLSGAQEYWREDAERLGKKLPELAVKKEPAPKIASPAQVLRRRREATQEMEA